MAVLFKHKYGFEMIEQSFSPVTILGAEQLNGLSYLILILSVIRNLLKLVFQYLH
jgi:hypothetical protein